MDTLSHSHNYDSCTLLHIARTHKHVLGVAVLGKGEAGLLRVDLQIQKTAHGAVLLKVGRELFIIITEICQVATRYLKVDYSRPTRKKYSAWLYILS